MSRDDPREAPAPGYHSAETMRRIRAKLDAYKAMIDQESAAFIASWKAGGRAAAYRQASVGQPGPIPAIGHMPFDFTEAR